jgi:hypothetical protein
MRHGRNLANNTVSVWRGKSAIGIRDFNSVAPHPPKKLFLGRKKYWTSICPPLPPPPKIRQWKQVFYLTSRVTWQLRVNKTSATRAFPNLYPEQWTGSYTQRSNQPTAWQHKRMLFEFRDFFTQSNCGFRSSEIGRRIFGWVVAGISKKRPAFTTQGQVSHWNPKNKVHRCVHTELKLISVIFSVVQYDSKIYTEEVTYMYTNFCNVCTSMDGGCLTLLIQPTWRSK